MADLISDAERAALGSMFNDIFDTFKRDIVIHKEPKKIINQVNTSQIFGYGDYAEVVNYTYVPVTETYPAIIKYNEKQTVDFIEEINSQISIGTCSIKVKKDCRDFIMNGKTEKIEFDGKVFNVISDDAVKSFLNATEFFIFQLEVTK
ncbi:hypothetical protein CL634_01575 [bacterium]|nr:hypothetical protein [bacterium]